MGKKRGSALRRRLASYRERCVDAALRAERERRAFEPTDAELRLILCRALLGAAAYVVPITLLIAILEWYVQQVARP